MPTSVIAIAATASTPDFTPPPPTDASLAALQAAQDTQASQPSQANSASEQSSAAAQLQAQLAEALKNTGIKTEIENEKSGLVIVRFVQAESGQLILQMPPQGVLDLVAQIEQQLQNDQSPVAGQIVDTKV